jgi:Ca-activated chloride channel homolog
LFSVENINAIGFLLTVPLLLLVAFYYKRWHYSTIAKLGNVVLVSKLLRGYSSKRQWLRTLGFMFALILIIIALIGPRFGTEEITEASSDKQIVFCVDVSTSMNATDVQPSRLARAKNLVQKILELNNKQQYGLVYFAGNAFVDVPITHDADAIRQSIDALSTKVIVDQGTAIGKALQASLACFNHTKLSGKAIVLVTDGEDHEEGIANVVAQCKEQSVEIYTVGVGTAQGGRFIDPNSGMEKTDVEGMPVVSTLNEKVLADIALKAGKDYYVLDLSTAQQISNDISGLSSDGSSKSTFTVYRQAYQYFLFVAIAILLADLFFIYLKSKQAIAS